MRMERHAVKLLLAMAAATMAGPAFAASDPRGIWVDDNGRGAVEIKDCGDKLCGHVVWTRDATDTKRGCGKQIIGDAAMVGDGLWDNGWIYSPERKSKFDVELKPLPDGTLRVKGYAGTKIFSKTMIWTKAPADIKRCDAETIEAKADPAPANADTDAKSATGDDAQPAPNSDSTAAAKPAPVAAPKPAAKSEPKPVAKAEPAEEPAAEDAAPATQDQAAKDKAAPKVAQAEDEEDGGSIEKLLGKLGDLKLGKEYGVKENGDGNCRLKVPYVELTFRCKE